MCARLEARGIRCWIAPRDVQPGLAYGEAIIDAIHGCRIMVVLLSSHANSSIHIAKEVERAVSHGATIIPLRIEAVAPAKSLDYFLSSVHWLDALTPPLERHLDNLADTIFKLLQPIRNDIVVGTAPKAAAAPAPGSVVPAAKNWLIPAIVGGLVVAVIVIVVLMGQGGSHPRNSGGNAGGSDSVPAPGGGGDASAPGPAAAPKSRPADSIPASGQDPVVGCWHWFNNTSVVIHSNGVMTAGPFTAQWRLVDSSRRVYNFTWPEAVDSAALSPDGRTLSGGNQYGFQMSATRLSGGPGLAGNWLWYNGGTVTIQPDGSFFVGSIRGRWSGAGLAYSLTWPKPVDTVTLSPDHTRVNGSNQFGVHISGTRTAGCGG